MTVKKKAAKKTLAKKRVFKKKKQKPRQRGYDRGLVMDAVCDLIASTSMGLHAIMAKLQTDNPKKYPTAKQVVVWIRDDELVSAKYARAKECQADFMAEEIISISDDSSQDMTTDENGNERLDSEHVQRSRLRVESRKWLAGKLRPKVYGEKIHNEHSDPDGKNPYQALADAISQNPDVGIGPAKSRK